MGLQAGGRAGLGQGESAAAVDPDGEDGALVEVGLVSLLPVDSVGEGNKAHPLQ